jgi:hypothetical protein
MTIRLSLEFNALSPPLTLHSGEGPSFYCVCFSIHHRIVFRINKLSSSYFGMMNSYPFAV